MDWKQKGREMADGLRLNRLLARGALLRFEDDARGWDEAIREVHVDLLAAARWGAGLTPAGSEDEAEAAALRLLTEGFRGRLTEIAGLTPTAQDGE